MKVIIVGGVAGGASAATRLRRLSEETEILILEKGPHISFSNCSLPYYVGGVVPKAEQLLAQSPQSFKERYNIEVRVEHEVLRVDPKNHTLEVKDLHSGETYVEKYDKLLLAPGAQPVYPASWPRDEERIFTLRTVQDALRIRQEIVAKKAKRAVIVGGGAIGLEMAENLSKLGLQVTVVEMADHLVAALDYDLACEVRAYAQRLGIEILLGQGVEELRVEAGQVKVKLPQERLLEADIVLLSLGVRPDTAWLKDSGLELNPRGAIITDSGMATSDPDILAVGDAVEIRDLLEGQATSIALAGLAHKEARVAADRLAGLDSRFQGAQGTAILKFGELTVASTGYNERQARAANLDYDKTYIYADAKVPIYPQASKMSVKVLWERSTQRLLGAQIVGYEGVDKRIDVLATALRFKTPITQLVQLELAYAPPFGTAKDVINYVGMVADNVTSGRLQQFFWDEVDALPRDGSCTLLDVRTLPERNYGYIEGFKHLPLDELRARAAQELPLDKPVYVHCQSGLRSYLACAILRGLGYKAWSLAGGYRLYHLTKGSFGEGNNL